MRVICRAGKWTETTVTSITKVGFKADNRLSMRPCTLCTFFNNLQLETCMIWMNLKDSTYHSYNHSYPVNWPQLSLQKYFLLFTKKQKFHIYNYFSLLNHSFTCKSLFISALKMTEKMMQCVSNWITWYRDETSFYTSNTTAVSANLLRQIYLWWKTHVYLNRVNLEYYLNSTSICCCMPLKAFEHKIRLYIIKHLQKANQ